MRSQAQVAGAVLVVLFGALGARSAAWADETPAPQRTIDRGRIELSTGFSFDRFKQDSDRDSYSILNVPLRVGYFVSRRAELEAEALVTVIDNDDDLSTGSVFSARVLYHFGDGAVHPFLSAGGGVGDSSEFLGAAIDAGRTVTHWELGGGVKIFAGSRAAFRLEYRYSHASANGDGEFASDNSLSRHRVVAGVALFFK
jgi:opacity protein-like surface antigen